MGLVLDGYPSWSQLTDPDPRTGLPDTAHATDCGEEVASMWIMGALHRYTDAADLRRKLSKPDADGKTTPDDVAHLLSIEGIRAKHNTFGMNVYRERVKAELDRGRPVALLGSWLSTTVLHWYLAIGYGNDYLLAMDPWFGRLSAVRWRLVYSLATGDVVQGFP